VNLLFTLTTYPPSIGGAQLHQHQLALQFIKRHSVQVVSQWDSARTDWLFGTTLKSPYPAKSYEIEGIPVRRITLSDETRRQLRPWVYGYYFLQGLALEHISEALAGEFRDLIKNCSLIHNVRIGREGLSLASLKLARERDIPFVLTPVHHPRWGGWLHRYYHKLYREANGVIALTVAEKQILISLGVSEDRVFVTGHGPVLAHFHDGAMFRAQHNLGEYPIVLFLGQKYSYKGFDKLLEAAPLVWKRWPETRFVFIGPRTHYSNKVFANVKDRRVLELDRVDLQDKTNALAACDVFCLPSSQESFGGVFTEAWSFEKPVIGCDIPAVREVVEHEINGLLLSPAPGDLAEAILTLLTQPELSHKLGQAGHQKVERLYSWPRLAELTEQAYRQILEGC
jgi:glycosyltransferase involved in cell wall biosynthesis